MTHADIAAEADLCRAEAIAFAYQYNADKFEELKDKGTIDYFQLFFL